MNKDQALQNLVDFRDVLDRFNCHYWLEAGTCLGCIRERDFIDHDEDIDFGILEEHFDWELVNSLIKDKGFSLLHIFGNRNCGLELAFERHGIKVDLFLFYKKGDKRWHGAWHNGGKSLNDLIKLVFEASLVERTILWKFKGENFYIPADYEDYLVARYGNEWRTPNKQWNWASDPKCIDKNFKI